jgi:hypothetical protein
LLVVFILSSLFLLELCLILLSVLDDSFGDILDGDITCNIVLFVYAKFLSDLIRINVTVFFENMVLIRVGVHHFRNVEALYLVLGNLIVASDDHIVNILASKNHENTFVQRQDWVLASLEVVYDIISPDSHIKEISLSLGLLQGFDMTVMQQVKAALDIDNFICGLGLTVVTEMHDSSRRCQEVRIRDADCRCFTSW